MPRKRKLDDPKNLAEYISKLILQKKGEDIQIFDLRKITSITDFFVICTATSDVHTKAIADFISEEAKKKGYKPWHSEGYTNLSWVLIDFVDVVVHIFLKETRKYYNLEGLWGDAEITYIKDEI
ncbi:MAG: ribosome silencing factor [Ignavibacteria bacterium]|nr:ribosome silencing factor [Ignavibacteria bacterium]